MANQLFQGQRFGREKVVVDGKHFERCTFKGTTLVFKGESPPNLVNNDMDGVRWEFDGPAGLTLAFLGRLYHGGFQQNVEQTFANIRRTGAHRTTPHLAECLAEDFEVSVLAQEVLSLATTAQGAWARLEFNGTEDPWVEIHGLLAACAGISRFLDRHSPKKAKNLDQETRSTRRKRIDRLRDIINLEPERPIFRRALRDHFEHFDERLHAFLDEPGPKTLIDKNIAPKGAIQVAGSDPDQFFRHFDRATMTVSFKDESMELRELAIDVASIIDKLSDGDPTEAGRDATAS